jgi:nucleotide-binding universal stress UspA family protein
VMGSRGGGGFSDVLLGSTAIRVVQLTDVPVLLVK